LIIDRMGLFSFQSKNKQESTSGEGEFYSRAEEDSQAARGRGKRTRSKSQNSAANEAVDPILPEKKRARRRLVGAVALVLAVIIGLPMILDSEPKPLPEDIAIQIPSKDKLQTNAAATYAPAYASAYAPLAASAPVLPAEREPMPPAPSTANAVSPAVPTGSASKAAPAKPKEKEVAKQVEPVRVAESAKQSAVVPEKTEAKPAPKPEPEQQVTEKHGEARAEAILEGKTDGDIGKPNPDKKSTKFVVQVAAFASQDKVNELQGKLTDAGIKSYTEKVPTASGQRIRVRVGPFSNKGDADGTRAKLEKLGLNGTVVPS
jgi:DedD protein